MGSSIKKVPQAGDELGEWTQCGEHRGLINGENQRSYIYTTNERRMEDTKGPPREVVHMAEPWYCDTKGNQVWAMGGKGDNIDL